MRQFFASDRKGELRVSGSRQVGLVNDGKANWLARCLRHPKCDESRVGEPRNGSKGVRPRDGSGENRSRSEEERDLKRAAGKLGNARREMNRKQKGEAETVDPNADGEGARPGTLLYMRTESIKHLCRFPLLGGISIIAASGDDGPQWAVTISIGEEGGGRYPDKPV